MVGTILVVDDDPQIRHSFERVLARDHTVLAASSGENGLDIVRGTRPDLVIMDVRMPGMDGIETYRQMRQVHPKLPVIIMTAYGDMETAIEATKLGAFDFVLKPFDIPAVLDLIEQAMAAGRFTQNRVAMGGTPDKPHADALIGRSPAMQEVYKAIGRVAQTEATVLIRGESGTGKELVARAIYQHSARSDRPFMVINCVAIPETLLESELFGYEKGAFTGAVSRRAGKIERANRGSVFLDEIGDMPFEIQAKILRLLQEKSIERLGGREPVPVDVRIIAATNRNLENAVAQGQFREDLYYRLNVVTLRLPPLRERVEDIPLLTDYFLARFSTELGVPNPGLSKEAREALKAHVWPGNVRELANCLQKALIFNRGFPLDPAGIAQAIGKEKTALSADALPGDAETDGLIRQWIRKKLTEGSGGAVYEDLINHFGSLLLQETLNLTGGNRTRAAKLLGLSRPTLLSKIDKYGLKITTSVSD
jgi:two-component system nitrogen regulation response regulator GlnG